MQRLTSVNPAEATGKAKQLLDGVQAKLGMTPNLMKTLATAPAALEAYLSFSGALGTGTLDAKLREQIALTVAQANACEYCLSAHSTIGKMVGLKPEEIAASRQAHSSDPKREAGLKFAQTVVVARGEVSDDALTLVRGAGYSDGEITEIVANVAINIFTNYFNHVARTDVDFPRVAVTLAE
ncbi:MAG: carboxymuconolactone decarboxylase family protein [Bryobacteraceae bacterium]|nr:carboxymuconolactone decarboxylase family protein [Bryobacteraceae bacterium]